MKDEMNVDLYDVNEKKKNKKKMRRMSKKINDLMKRRIVNNLMYIVTMKV